MEPYRYQRKDNQERTPEVRDSKPLAGEIKMILGGLMVGEVPEKSTSERDKQHSFAAPSNEDAKE